LLLDKQKLNLLKQANMRTTNKIITMSLMVLGMAFAGCSDKKDDPQPTPAPTPTPTATEYLTAHSWKMTALTSSVVIDWGTYWYGSPNGAPTTDGYSQTPACEKDDTYRFFTNSGVNSVTYDEGGSKCDPADPQSGSAGTWMLSASNTILTFGAEDWTIDALGENTLKMHKDYNNGSGGIYTVTYTFSKV
jgi:hypothetical protein